MIIHKSRRYRLLEIFWQGRRFLYPLACIYQVLVAVRALLYRHILPTHTLPGKTISIGNISIGGSGKTPVVIAIGKHLVRQGKPTVVLTRGYGSGLRRQEFIVLQNGKIIMCRAKETKIMLDEPLLISHALPSVPVIVGARRFIALSAYLSRHQQGKPTYFLLDDGFQHLQIKRDIDVVLVDVTQPFAHAKLLPRGMLREPISALQRADVVLFTRAQVDDPDYRYLAQTKKARTAKVIFRMTGLHPSPATTASFSPNLNPVLFVCGVAFPYRVLDELEKFCRIHTAIYLADHEPVNRVEVEQLLHHVNAVITTAKDYYRDREFYDHLSLPVFIPELETDIDVALLLDCN